MGSLLLTNVPLLRSLMASLISSFVDITIGPYHSIFSPVGSPPIIIMSLFSFNPLTLNQSPETDRANEFLSSRVPSSPIATPILKNRK